METYVLKRNEDLCYKLGMNFDEANELFGSETLSGMQMVQVNGGIDWGKIGTYVMNAIDFIASCITITSCSGPSTSVAPSTQIEVNGDGNGSIKINGYGVISIDSMITTVKVGNDTIITNKAYGITSSPTPPSGPTYMW